MCHSIYIHIPFCHHRCNYCDFATNVGRAELIPGYVEALTQEFRVVSKNVGEINVHSIYFGGGTPSILSIHQYKKLLVSLKSQFLIKKNCEICLEANPGTLSKEYLSGLKDLGFNRISMGVQSTNPSDLNRLERIHDLEDVLLNIKYARKVGIKNINIDLIFGLPWQDLQSWKNNLERAIQLNPGHFSLYSLIIEEGTAIYDWYNRGLITLLDQDIEGEMFEYAMERLDQAGYEHYEISNWSKRDPYIDYRCRHNMQYWLNLPYLGFGVSAHGYFGGVRTINTPNLSEYINKANQNKIGQVSLLSPANTSSKIINKNTQMKDQLLLGLRLTQSGVDNGEFSSRFGKLIEDVFEEEIKLLEKQGLVEWWKGRNFLRLTKRGVMVANQVFMHFV